MRLGIMVATAALASTMGFAAVDAAPMNVAPLASASASVQPAVSTGDEASLIQVREGCGFGAHRGWYGRCRLNGGWRGRVRAHEFYRNHGYPYRYHRGY